MSSSTISKLAKLPRAIMPPRPCLIASLGNPGSQYSNTRHSAGHILLDALLEHAGAPMLAKDTGYGGALVATLAAEEADTLFYKSPSLMNVSGPPLQRAWKAFSAQARSSTPLQDETAGSSSGATASPPKPLLVVLHDEMELPLGKALVKPPTSGRSARGHNGLKSLLDQPEMRALEFARVGVGIGPRPTSRDPDVVARFVLARMDEREREVMGGLAEGVWDAVERLRTGNVKKDGSGISVVSGIKLSKRTSYEVDGGDSGRQRKKR